MYVLQVIRAVIELSESGPILWNVLTSLNLDVVRAGFSQNQNTSFKMPFRVSCFQTSIENVVNISDYNIHNRF